MTIAEYAPNFDRGPNGDQALPEARVILTTSLLLVAKDSPLILLLLHHKDELSLRPLKYETSIDG
jgi:hypothetical protein